MRLTNFKSLTVTYSTLHHAHRRQNNDNRCHIATPCPCRKYDATYLNATSNEALSLVPPAVFGHLGRALLFSTAFSHGAPYKATV